MALAVACGGTPAEPTNFSSAEGRFSAEFPSEPTQQTEQLSEAGLDLEFEIFTSESDNYAVSVGYVDYPEGFASVDPNVVLSGVAEGAAGNIGAEVTRNNPTTFKGLPAVDYEVTSDDVSLQAKAFLQGNRLYLLQAVSAELGDAAAEYARLVETFELVG